MFIHPNFAQRAFSGGLSPTGAPEGHCSKSTGQVYARAEAYNNAYAIMYSWYMPKVSQPDNCHSYDSVFNAVLTQDEPSTGIGHRHDWEGIVVWIDDPTKTEPTILGAAASAHGKFGTTTSPPLDGTGPLIKYESIWPLDHSLGFTDTVGGQQPLITWETLTDAARTALQNTDFGDANVPFKDGNFEYNLGLAEL